MNTFTIDSDDNITAYALRSHAARTGQPYFSTPEELSEIARDSRRVLRIWNSLPGVTPTKRFTDRSVGVQRIWKAIQNLQPEPVAPELIAQEPEVATTKPRRSHKRATVPRDGSKQAQVLDLLRQPNGASLAEIMSATGWQAHSVRGFIAGTVSKKMGLTVESFKAQGANGPERTYRLPA